MTSIPATTKCIQPWCQNYSSWVSVLYGVKNRSMLSLNLLLSLRMMDEMFFYTMYSNSGLSTFSSLKRALSCVFFSSSDLLVPSRSKQSSANVWNWNPLNLASNQLLCANADMTSRMRAKFFMTISSTVIKTRLNRSKSVMPQNNQFFTVISTYSKLLILLSTYLNNHPKSIPILISSFLSTTLQLLTKLFEYMNFITFSTFGILLNCSIFFYVS